MLVRGGGVALWRQIYSKLEAAIVSGDFGPGDRLPSEQSLSGEFGVNRHTIRRALGVLEEAPHPPLTGAVTAGRK